MASNPPVEDSVNNSSKSESSDNCIYIERVRKFLNPLETRWNYVQTVLLWERPTHSLCYFIGMTALFATMASGTFRLVLLLVVMMASSLLLDDVRVKVWQLLQIGGFGAVDKDRDSQNTSPSFSHLCERLALVWSCFSAWYQRLDKLKTNNLYKYYGILFGLLLAAVSAYQYLPLMKISYLTACALFFWPVVKHHGIHTRVKKILEPFYRPFVVQWQHSRTKRQRDIVPKVTDGERPADSDEEFTKDFYPTADDTVVDQHNTLLEEELSMPESPSPDPPLQIKFLEGIISSAITQGLNSVTRKEDQNGSSDDTQSENQETTHGSTPDSRSPSFDSPSVFLEHLQFPSISQATDTFEFEEGEFMEGLEFPDIEKDSDSEPTHSVGESQVDSKLNEINAGEGQAMASTDKLSKQVSPESIMSTSGNTDISDYEMLEQSDAEGMTHADESDNVDTTDGLVSVSKYVGKWLGY